VIAKVVYEGVRDSVGSSQPTHDLTLKRSDTTKESVTFFDASCFTGGGHIWALDTPYFSVTKPEVKDTIPITDHMVIVKALVHCIDTTSGRSAVHDPDRYHELEQEHERYKELKTSGRMSGLDRLRWSWTIKEMEERGRMKGLLEITEWDE
jgi:hypothetical protein